MTNLNIQPVLLRAPASVGQKHCLECPQRYGASQELERDVSKKFTVGKFSRNEQAHKNCENFQLAARKFNTSDILLYIYD